MSNITQIDQASATPDQKELFHTVKKPMGMVPNLIPTLAQSCAAVGGYLAFDNALAKGSFPAKCRELISVVSQS